MDKWERRLLLRAITLFNVCFAIIQVIINLKSGELITVLYIMIAILFVEVVFVGIPVLIIMASRGSFKKRKIKSVEQMNREINEKYTPAMASMLIDVNVESNKDILATIFDLYVRKYLNIKDYAEIIVNEKNTDNLYLHEQYVINQINNNKHIETEKFKDLVNEDCRKYGLIEDKNNGELKKILVYILLACIIAAPCIIFLPAILTIISYALNAPGLKSFAENNIPHFMLIIIGLGLLDFILLGFFNDNIRTKKGKEVAKEYRGFKEYLKEYTLVKTRDVEYIEILDRYLTYALALEEADEIEKKLMKFNKIIEKYIIEEELKEEKNERTNC